MNRQFVVVGLGRLGISMVATLDSLGHEVLAIDKTLPHRDSVLHDGDVLVVGGTRKDLDSSPLVQPDG
jgi:Trk K+ transport system NAD-binding subunit